LANGQQTPDEFEARAKSGDRTALLKLTAMATQGNGRAQSILGWLYLNGFGVPKDWVTAAGWYRKAAEQGADEAQTNLGDMYRNGLGVPVDPVTAIQWFRKAAEKGDFMAQAKLGEMYRAGEGVPKDPVLAYMWFNLSSASGYDFSVKARDSLEQKMTSAQIAEAQKLTREWKPKH
jgi:TPR repeat protein